MHGILAPHASTALADLHATHGIGIHVVKVGISFEVSLIWQR